MIPAIAIALRAIAANRLRSALTMCGVMIGIAAVIALQAIGEGQKQAQLEIYSKLGANRVLVFPGWRRTGGVGSIGSSRLDLPDAEAMIRLEEVRLVSPVAFVRTQTKYLANTINSQIVGTLPEFVEVENYKFRSGRMFDAAEVNSWARVAILGATAAEGLFGSRDPVGEDIRIQGKSFNVIGVFEAKGDLGFFNPDEQIVVPLTTAWTKLGAGPGLQQITLQAQPGTDTKMLEETVKGLLQERHPMYARNPDIFQVYNAAEMQQQQEAAAKMISGFLLVVGAIALFIGGVGIMNIMLVTVSERTREIGLRKAIGATPGQIMGQFLAEAVVLCGLAGVLGVATGVGIAQWLAGSAERLEFPAPVVQQQAVYIAVSVAVSIGLIFGTTPALRAARLDPIRALRHE